MPLCHCSFFAYTLQTTTSVLVYIPSPKRSESADISLDERYPDGCRHKLLYLLHGMYEDETTWLRKSNIERYAEEKQLAVVMPSVQNSYYTDLPHGPQYFSFLTEELPRFVCSLFPLSRRREDTFIAGLSMGGYGACKAAFLRPDLYSAFASLSGAVDISLIGQYASNEERRLYEGVFGPVPDAPGGKDDLFAIAENLHKLGGCPPEGYIACGTDDKLCLPMNRKLRDCMEKCGFVFHYTERSGSHEWNFWDSQIQTVLNWLPL